MTRAKDETDRRSAPELIRIGHVRGAHGVHGAIRVKLDNPNSALLRQLGRLILARGEILVEHRVTSVQPAGRGTFKVLLEGITRAEDALAMSGAAVMVAVSALPRIKAREFYYFEVVGCEVITLTGSPVGTIEDVFFNGANDIWVVRDRGAEHLLPVTDDVVKQIELAERRVVIEAIPGLLD